MGGKKHRQWEGVGPRRGGKPKNERIGRLLKEWREARGVAGEKSVLGRQRGGCRGTC